MDRQELNIEKIEVMWGELRRQTGTVVAELYNGLVNQIPEKQLIVKKVEMTEQGVDLRNGGKVVLVTSIIDVTPELIVDLYRQRWQIEPAFKRLKSLFKYHEIPVYVEASTLSWFYEKLLLAALVNVLKNIHHLAALCANSKRKRLPALYRLLVPK